MAPWRVLEVVPLAGYVLRVRFFDGTEGCVEMSEFLGGNLSGTVFAPLQDPTFFAQVGIDSGVVTWPGEIDLAPDTMYHEIKQAGVYRMSERIRKAA